MSAPLVVSLLSRLNQAENQIRRSCLKIELACYYARAGEFELARQIKYSERQLFGKGENLEVSVRLLCLDSLILMFEEESQQASDRMARANLLSNAALNKELIALTSAWQSAIAFNCSDFRQMMLKVRICDENLNSVPSEAGWRMALTMAAASQLADAQHSSAFWYQRTRETALVLGDQAATGALIFNQAAYRLVNCRMKSMEGSLAQQELESLRIDVQSAVSYQKIACINSLHHWLRMLEIGVLALLSRPTEADVEIENLLRSGCISETSSDFFSLQADRVMSLALLGRNAEARPAAVLIENRLLNDIFPDDKAQLAHSLYILAAASNDQDRISYWGKFRDVQINRFRQIQLELRTLIESKLRA